MLEIIEILCPFHLCVPQDRARFQVHRRVAGQERLFVLLYGVWVYFRIGLEIEDHGLILQERLRPGDLLIVAPGQVATLVADTIEEATPIMAASGERLTDPTGILLLNRCFTPFDRGELLLTERFVDRLPLLVEHAIIGGLEYPVCAIPQLRVWWVLALAL